MTQKWQQGWSAGATLSMHGGEGRMTGSAGAWGRRSSRTLPTSWSLRTSPCHLLQGEHLRAHPTPRSPSTASTRDQSCRGRSLPRQRGIWTTSGVIDRQTSVAEAAGKVRSKGKWQRCPSVALTHCWHGMLQLKARQFRAWWRRMNGRGPVSRHLQLPAGRGLKHAHALEKELSMLTGGVSYCRFSFHGGVKHVRDRSYSA